MHFTIQDFTMHYLEVVKLVGFGGQAVTHECVVSEFCSVILLNSESTSFARCNGVIDLTSSFVCRMTERNASLTLTHISFLSACLWVFRVWRFNFQNLSAPLTSINFYPPKTPTHLVQHTYFSFLLAVYSRSTQRRNEHLVSSKFFWNNNTFFDVNQLIYIT